ncbi:uncharacterized protein LOC103524116 [Trichonephila clavipes]|nr:uncharacterized protein LOC103524116 [Trichonephila clavipes]
MCTSNNSHCTRPRAAQKRFTVNGWTNIVGDSLLDSYILPPGLDSNKYLVCLQKFLPELLTDVSSPVQRRMRVRQLTWTKHIAKVVENATSRLSLLNRTAGVKWGSSQTVWTSTFTSYIIPVIDYGSKLLVTTSDRALSKLYIAQNKALRFITGAATSTPFACLQLQTEISSSSERRQYSARSLGERLMRKDHFWPKYIPSQTRLKTQHTFLFEFHRLTNIFGVSDNRLPLFRPTIFPGHLRYVSVNLDLVMPFHKHNSLLAELRYLAVATIHERYPDQDWLHVFTDGSARASFGRTGAGAFSNSFNLKEPLSAWSDNFDGEIYAIFMAFKAISTTPGLNIVIFIDSQATIKTVSSYNLFYYDFP